MSSNNIEKLEFLMSQRDIEKDLREQNPIVKQAWERYCEVRDLYIAAQIEDTAMVSKARSIKR